MNIKQLDNYSEEKIRALFGMTRAAWAALFAQVLPELMRRRRAAQALQSNRQRAPGGGRVRQLRPYQEVLLTLLYLRHNVAHAVVGERFGVSADTSENTFHEVLFVLREVCPSERWEAEKRWQKSQPNWTPDRVDRARIDSFESPVRRPSRNERQRRVYSGKKKRHTLKTQVVTDARGEILGIDAGHRGPAADKKIYEQSGVARQYPKATQQGDLGYQGATGVEVPHKQPKGGQRTEAEKAENRQKASVRVHVEHGIRRIKGWRIVRDDYRLALGLFPLIATTVVGRVQMVRIIS